MEINCDIVESKNCLQKKIANYCCHIGNLINPKDIEYVRFVGDNEKKEFGMNSKEISFINYQLQKFPEGLSKIFPNLTKLYIKNSKDLRQIRKEDLRGLEKLKHFGIYNCNLEYLPGNLFEDMKDLEWIDFSNNQIKFIGENLLDGLTKLRYFYFYGNKNINSCFDAGNPQSSTLKKIKQEFRVKCAPDYSLEICVRTPNEWKKLDENFLKKISELEEIMDDIKKFADNENFKDIKLKVGQEEFKLHKFILAARSPTFAELFTENPAAEELKLVDISVEAFKIFIDFVYNNQLPQNEINSLEIFQMAGKLKVEKLKQFAAAKLMTKISLENAFEVLKCANKHQHEELIRKSFEEIKKMFPTIQLKDELAKNLEKIQKLIDAKAKMEEIIRAEEQT